MTDRERFCQIMAFQPADRLPALVLEPYEEEAITRWHGEGLPAGVTPWAHLGLCQLAHVPISFGPIPGFEPRVLADDGVYETVVSGMGAVIRRRKDHPSMFYGHLEHPVKSRADWEQYRQRFQALGRLPQNWQEEVVPALEASTRPVGICFFPFFFRLGFYALGMERFLRAFYDEPGLIHDMFSYWAGFVTETIKPILGTVRLDYAVFGEDLAGKNGPLISPRTYEEFWAPYQAPLLQLLRASGIPVVCHWSAGQFDALLPSMLDQGFNCIWPLEVTAGADPLELRRRYGRDLLLAGGIAKEAVIAGPEAIDQNLQRLLPLIREGGFIPALDDMASPDMPYAHYRYLHERVGEVQL